ncbi:hypothetical protein BCR33DRAFT_721724 [Rhizoclosmatium globosum]|uniref:DUF4097 domain-containing protein n=1 Tax=Rhizoclosmatium globosum TaxID=329046 RepID=A0A1Y2BQR3_9FUNG|nr:hypothetical protein BCR33DRAFT_721724 [Rhizoclosmatium globosum]|eukprot:ORY37092.1 hypothetical protein BCR33DRAFT_721724 [Rhizoclosmatium globosum]
MYYHTQGPTEVQYSVADPSEKNLVVITQNKRSLILTNDFPEGTYYLPWYSVPATKSPPKVVLYVTVPEGLQSFTLNGNVCSLDWRGPALERGFSATIHTGSVRAPNLTAGTVDAKTSMGSVDITALKAKKVDLSVGTGSISAKSRKFEGKVTAHTSVGSCSVEGTTVTSGSAYTRVNGGSEGFVGREGSSGAFKAAVGVGSVTLQF